MRHARPFGLAAALLTITSSTPARRPAAMPEVVANDNRHAAGRLRHDTLSVSLVVQWARWKPEAPGDSGVVVAAFSEEGEAPRIPGPLLRMRTGTVINLTVRNAIGDSSITLLGLAPHPAKPADSTSIAPGASAKFQFTAGAAGTYLYQAVVGHHDYDTDEERETTTGAFVVDPPGGSPPDRIFVINIWSRAIDSVSGVNALAINGRSWPWTERISAELGDTVRWRWVNASARNHPMHLHGFYFKLDATGTGFRDTRYEGAARRLIVTQDVRPFQTFDMSWAPDRPGNWLMHCHIGFHVIAGAADLHAADTSSHREMSADPRQHMAGLVLGINVPAPRGWRPPARHDVRTLRLFIDEGKRRGVAERALGFVLQRGATPPAPDSVEIAGSQLTLTRGQPTDVVVINRLREPAIIHWHGIELESYSDGVAGWSGDGRRLAPTVQPGDSFVARLTLPRAGTFMYHTHFNDIEQLTSGMYGPIVVVEPGEPFDPARDHVYIGGWDGPAGKQIFNGDSIPPPLQLAAGVAHRFRFINIGMAGGYWPALRQDSTLVRWSILAKDGAAFPPSEVKLVPAHFRAQVGETWDFSWTPAPGEYRLGLGDRDKPQWVQRVIVH